MAEKVYMVTKTEWTDFGFTHDKEEPRNKSVKYFWELRDAKAYLFEEFIQYLESNKEEIIYLNDIHIEASIDSDMLNAHMSKTFDVQYCTDKVDIEITEIIPE